jgi:hypothetical protein
VAGLALGLLASAQSLHVTTSQADHDRPGLITVALEAPKNKAPVGLQWEISVPAALTVEKDDISAGKAAEAAHKALTCSAARKAETQPTTRYVCVLVGGNEPIGNGPVLVIRYRAHIDVQGAPIRLAIEKALGVTADLKSMAIPGVEAIIKLH